MVFLHHYGLTVDVRKGKFVDNHYRAVQKTIPVRNAIDTMAMTAVLPENGNVADLLQKMFGLT